MTDEQWEEGELISLLGLGAMLLRNWRRIARWTCAGVLLAVLWLLRSPLLFTSNSSFIPEGNDANRASGLASLAGQFGVQIPNASLSLSPEFYAKLLKSPVVLRTIARDSFLVQELTGKRIAFADLFKITGESPVLRDAKCVKLLTELVKTASEKTTGVVSVSVATKWPSVSFAIVTALVNGVNEFNLKTRQGQATAERKFIEGRLSVASANLREAEDRLEQFLRNNRQITNSPELEFRHDRLQRDVSMKQTVQTSLAQSYEQVRLREVRDTPVISMLEPPSFAVLPNPRGRLIALLTGFLLGAFGGTVAVYASASLALRRQAGDPKTFEFLGALKEFKSDVLGQARRLRSRFQRS